MPCFVHVTPSVLFAAKMRKVPSEPEYHILYSEPTRITSPYPITLPSCGRVSGSTMPYFVQTRPSGEVAYPPRQTPPEQPLCHILYVPPSCRTDHGPTRSESHPPGPGARTGPRRVRFPSGNRTSPPVNKTPGG